MMSFVMKSASYSSAFSLSHCTFRVGGIYIKASLKGVDVYNVSRNFHFSSFPWENIAFILKGAAYDFHSGQIFLQL